MATLSKVDYDPFADSAPTSEPKLTKVDYDPFAAPKPKLTRSWGEAAKDTGAGVLSGFAGLVRTGGDLYGMATGDTDNLASELGTNAQSYWQDAQSDSLKQSKLVRSQKIDQADGVLGQAGTAIAETFKNPALIGDVVAENLPSLIPGLGAGKLVKGSQFTRGVATGLTKEAAEKAAASAGVKAAIGVGSVQQGGDVAGGVYRDAVEKTDWATNPEFLQRVASGEAPEAVKHELALSASRAAFVPAAALSLATQALPDGATIEKAIIGGLAKQGGVKGVALGAAKGFLGEGMQEAGEEGGGQLAGNIAQQQIVDARKDITEGVGESAGLGFAGGGLLGGPAGALGGSVAEQPANIGEQGNQAPPVVERPKGTLERALDLLPQAVVEPVVQPAAPIEQVAQAITPDVEPMTTADGLPAVISKPVDRAPVQAPAPPWVNTETGEFIEPTDDEVKQQLRQIIKVQQESRSGVRLTNNILSTSWGVPADRIRALRSQVMKEPVGQEEQTRIDIQDSAPTSEPSSSADAQEGTYTSPVTASETAPKTPDIPTTDAGYKIPDQGDIAPDKTPDIPAAAQVAETAPVQATAQDKNQDIYDDSSDVLDDDITTQSGTPFSVIGAAEVAARREGETARVVPVGGGFVVRQPKAQGEVTNELARAGKAEPGIVESGRDVLPPKANLDNAPDQSAVPPQQTNPAPAQATAVAAPQTVPTGSTSATLTSSKTDQVPPLEQPKSEVNDNPYSKAAAAILTGEHGEKAMAHLDADQLRAVAKSLGKTFHPKASKVAILERLTEIPAAEHRKTLQPALEKLAGVKAPLEDSVKAKFPLAVPKGSDYKNGFYALDTSGNPIISTGGKTPAVHSSPQAAQKYAEGVNAERAKRAKEQVPAAGASPVVTQKPNDIRTKNDTSLAQAARNSRLGNIKSLSNGPDAESIRVHGFESVDREIQHVVLSQVRTALNDGQVFRTIIESVPVDVVDGLIGKKTSTKQLLNNKTMLTSSLSVPRDAAILEPVSRFINALAAAVKSASTATAAEETGLNSSSRVAELSGKAEPAIQTVRGDNGHGVVQIAGKTDTVNITPTENQIKAGSYKKGHFSFNGLDITIENPAGSKRRPEWPPLKNHYGYFKGTIGADKDHVDVFLSDDAANADLPVFIVDQYKKDGSYDEAKVMLGWADEAAAVKAYSSNYQKGWKVGPVTQMTLEQFKVWIYDPAKTKKPAAPVVKQEFTTESKAKIEDGNVRLFSKPESFSDQVRDRLKSGETRGGMLDMGRTPAVLRMLGFSDLPLRMPAGVLNKIATGKAGERAALTEAQIIQLPEQIDEPVAIFKDDRGLLLVTSMVDSTGNPVVVGIQPNATEGYADVNIVATAFGQDNPQAKAKKAIEEGRLLFKGKKQNPRLSLSGLVQRQTDAGNAEGSGVRILQDGDLSNYRAQERARRLSFRKPDNLQQSGNALSMADGQRLKTQLTKNWGDRAPSVVLVENAEGFPADAKLDPDYRRGEGFFNGKKTVWINLGNIRSGVDEKGKPRSVQKHFETVLLHEALGHFGVENIIGTKDWAQIRLAIKNLIDNNTGSEAVKSAIASAKRRYPNVSEADFDKEVIAIMAERGLRNGLIDRVIVKVRQFIRKIMPTLVLSDREIVDLLHQSENFLRQGTPQAERQAQARAMAFSNAPGNFYSALSESVQRATGAPKTGNATAWKQWLDGAQRRGEFKQEERDWLGVDAWLDENESVTRAQLADFVRANQVQVTESMLGDTPETNADLPEGWEVVEVSAGNWEVRDEDGETASEGSSRANAISNAIDEDERVAIGVPKFSQYQLPGGKNYRELLLTLPAKTTPSQDINAQLSNLQSRIYDAEQEGNTVEAERLYQEAVRISNQNDGATIGSTQTDSKDTFRSSHFDQPNVLAHVRFNERTDADGKKMLFIEEVQSDWHQKGRKDGYAKRLNADQQSRKEALDKITETRDFTDAEQAEYDSLRTDDTGGFAVPDAPFKTSWPMLSMKRMIRYAADNGFDRIAWTTGEQQAERYDLSKQIDSLRVRKDGDSKYTVIAELKGGNLHTFGQLTEKELPEHVGKELAEKIVNQKDDFHKYAGIDLKVGGRGMIGFYDKILPSEVNKFAKRFGGKVGKTSFVTGIDVNSSFDNPDLTSSEAHSLDITPDMRAAAQQGLPLFSKLAAEGNLTKLFKTLGKFDKAFKYPISDKDDLTGVISDVLIDSVMKVKIVDTKARARFEPNGKVLPATRTVIQMGESTNNIAVVWEEKEGNRLFVNAAALDPGVTQGSALYMALFNYAKNAGKVFIGDPSGLSDEALLRRTELMAAAAIKHGGTWFMEPHPRQVKPNVKWATPVTWTPGDIEGNTESLLQSAYNNSLAFAPEIKNVYFDFDSGNFLGDNGTVITERELDRIARSARAAFQGRPNNFDDAAAAAFGRTTIARGVLANTVLRGEREGRTRLVDILEGKRGSADPAIPKALKERLYSKPDPAESGVFVEGGFSKADPQTVESEIESVMAATRSDTIKERASEWLKALTPGKVKDTLRSTWLGGLTLRHLAELGESYLPGIDRYMKYVQQMGADRNQLQEEADTFAGALRTWASKNREEAKLLAKLQHDTTIAGSDPSKEFTPSQFTMNSKTFEATKENVREAIETIKEQMRGRSGDQKIDMFAKIKALRGLPARDKARRNSFGGLVARWNNLSKEAQDFYKQQRDMYSARSELMQKALEDRVKDLSVTGEQKQRVISMIREQFESARLQGVYFPLQRFGKYFVAAEKNGESAFLMFEDLNKLERAVKDLRNRGFTINASGYKGDGKAKDAPSGTFVADVISALDKAKVSVDTQDQIYQIYLQALPELSMRKHSIHRQAVQGFDPDAIRAFAYNMHHGAHQLARLRYSHVLESIRDGLKGTQDIKRKEAGSDTREIVAGDTILDELGKRHEWIMNPQDSAATNFISSLGFVYYLGATPAAALVNLTQTALITFPYLASRFGPAKAMQQLMSGMKDSIRTNGNIDKTLKTEEEHKAYAELKLRGSIDKTQAHNLAGIAESGTNIESAAWAKAMKFIGYYFHKTEVVNREASGMAAFRLARESGMPFDEAVAFADKTIADTHFDYTNANRARFMQSGPAKVLLMFRQYSLNMTWFLGRNVWNATKGETPEVKKLARRNLVGTLGMSAIFSGTLGLPMMSVMFGVINAVAASLGDDDEPFDAETEFRNFLSDMLGQGAGQLVATGLANKFSSADIASRVSLSQLWFRDADRELDGYGAYNYMLEQIAGPIGGIGKNLFVGKQLIDDGKIGRGIETMLPKALKDGMKSLRYATDGVNNLRGDPLVADPSLYELVLQLNGFTPKEVAEQYDTNRALKNYEKTILDRRTALIDAFAMSNRMQDVEAKREAIAKIQQFNQTNPEVGITQKTLNRSIVTRARYSQNAENGVVLNKKLAQRTRENARYSDEGADEVVSDE